MVMAGCAIGSIAVILLFTVTRFDTTVSIYRDGVERYVRRRILFSTQVSRLFLPWNEISAIGVGDIGVRGGNFEPGKHPPRSTCTPSLFRTPCAHCTIPTTESP